MMVTMEVILKRERARVASSWRGDPGEDTERRSAAISETEHRRGKLYEITCKSVLRFLKLYSSFNIPMVVFCICK